MLVSQSFRDSIHMCGVRPDIDLDSDHRAVSIQLLLDTDALLINGIVPRKRRKGGKRLKKKRSFNLLREGSTDQRTAVQDILRRRMDGKLSGIMTDVLDQIEKTLPLTIKTWKMLLFLVWRMCCLKCPERIRDYVGLM